MLKEYEIVCIRRTNNSPSLIFHSRLRYSKITHIGCIGYPEMITIEKAIEMIESLQFRFYVKSGANKIRVTVITSNPGSLLRWPVKYLRTVANGIETDNLEQLPTCS